MPIYIIDRANNKISALSQTTFQDENINEASELQKYLINSIDIIEKDLFILSEEFGDWEESRRRIDILCLDKSANLVVVELKRTEDGGHMELQAIRYAAMISHMTFDTAVEAYKHYIEKHNLNVENPQKEILDYLDWEDVQEEDFANDVRIILVSANFSKEITTSVLWLLDREIDIKCIRIIPHKDDSDLFLEIQQIVPLPEAADFQVKLNQKNYEQRLARKVSRDYSKFDVTINGIPEKNLNKRKTIYFVISQCVKSEISPTELMITTGKGKWIEVDTICNTKSEFESEIEKNNDLSNYDSTRWFNADDELITYDGKTYAYSNQQGIRTQELVNKIFETYPKLNGKIIKVNS